MTTQPTPSPTSTPYDPAQASQRDVVYIVGNIMGILSIGFGSLGVLLSFVPLVGVLSLPLCIGGIFWGGIGALVLHLGRRGSVRFPLIGMALCVAALVIAIIVNVLFFGAAAASNGM